ncbi:hypothetical protein PF005_g24304 [Phytophthora fragariae]|uniref:Uncharacterized protein n=1 Tax=Phytophthora fragariae TaxID=53985 RepID=A0A6A3W368_9STRA|nr:hypothetical protein PF003_g8443 [Phytophthora fragariae]KAE8995416.1 hypothetical protein PF011_g16339 [Phytophthora fragariae]KAE9089673.1 hypothetical protein PF010_g18894 [Phytophthora fragariae]KAE9097930.1 hypothetical protein PF006_g23470 [Phytophthora fragariae]KAE9098010.1 hypothetical protein PF007_g16418 [Phytophthora fragariae]
MPRSVGQADIAPEVRLQVSLYLAQRASGGACFAVLLRQL